VAYPDEITYESLFVVTGNPLPSDVDAIYTALLNETLKEALGRCSLLCRTRGYALPDIITCIISDKVLDTAFPSDIKTSLLEKLSDLEYRCSFATTVSHGATDSVV
jgi:hypothetical protein